MSFLFQHLIPLELLGVQSLLIALLLCHGLLAPANSEAWPSSSARHVGSVFPLQHLIPLELLGVQSLLIALLLCHSLLAPPIARPGPPPPPGTSGVSFLFGI